MQERAVGGVLMTRMLINMWLHPMPHFAWMQPFSENPSSLLLNLDCIPSFTCVAAPFHQVETKELGVWGEFELDLYTGHVYGMRICVAATPFSVITPDDGRCSVNNGAGHSGKVWEWAGRGPGIKDWEGCDWERQRSLTRSQPCSAPRPRVGRMKGVLRTTQHSQGRFLYSHSVSRD